MELSERIRIRAEGNTDFKPYYDVLGQWADEVAQLEADVTKLENEVIRLEDENDALSKKNESLMKLAGMYIKSYEDLAFGDALPNYCAVCNEHIEPVDWDERHSEGEEDYHENCCPYCDEPTTDEPQDERS